MRKASEIICENSYESLGPGFYKYAEPTPFEHPYLAALNPEIAEFLGIDPSESSSPDFVQFFSGRRPLKGSKPLAMRYTGHQFGAYNPDIGDGRAILLGELRGADGRLYDLHLKGGGRTPYARVFDGRAVLRSCIREYLCGEAMHGLGIPTTRSLCIIGSDEPVRRERVENAAMLVRVSQSHVRFGSFEALYYAGEHEALKKLADHVIERHFQPLAAEPSETKYLLLLKEVIRSTASLMAQWQACGFTHGVMNTDNMSILGLTLDYGPYGFMEDFDPSFIPNHSDEAGRYAYNRQPPIALWNLACLAQALAPLADPEKAVNALEDFVGIFEKEYLSLMRGKLGLEKQEEEDAELVTELLKILEEQRADYSIFFRELCSSSCPGSFISNPSFHSWNGRYEKRLSREASAGPNRFELMRQKNPKYILRNYMAQTAIEKAEQDRDFSEIENLRVLLSRPFDEHPDMNHYSGPSPDWGRHLSVSCSS